MVLAFLRRPAVISLIERLGTIFVAEKGIFQACSCSFLDIQPKEGFLTKKSCNKLRGVDHRCS